MCRGRITLLHAVMIFCFISFPAADQETITAQSGQDVTLTCRAPNNNFIVVEWRRPDLGEVFVYRNNHFDSDDQHPSFKNRVDLQDRQMKDGDVSVILKDAMINDTGTYECRIFMEGTNRVKRAHQTIDPNSIIYLRVVDPSVQKNITAESGQKNVTLTCRAPNNNITAVEWSRADLGDEYVLLYRDGHVESDKQHPSFMNRVDLEDRKMKDGDVSLILKDVTTADNGTYECRVFQRRTNRGKRANLKTPPISIIYLSVVDPPGQRGDTDNGGKGARSIGLKVGLPVGLVAAVCVCFLIYRKVQQDSYQPPPEPV